jgi:transposase
MRALDPEVVEVIWQAVDPLLPAEVETHRLGGHRSRVPDRLCLWGMLIRLVTGSSWVDIQAILEHRVSDMMLRARRDEWIAAGVFEQLNTEALERPSTGSRGYDYPVVRSRLATIYGLNDLVIQPRRSKQLGKKPPVRLGLRWIVEATNTWWSNHGQLRRNIDRRTHHRHDALCLATTIILIIGRLIDHRTRWSPA